MKHENAAKKCYLKKNWLKLQADKRWQFSFALLCRSKASLQIQEDKSALKLFDHSAVVQTELIKVLAEHSFGSLCHLPNHDKGKVAAH